MCIQSYLRGSEKVSWASRPWLFSGTNTTGEMPVEQISESVRFRRSRIFVLRISGPITPFLPTMMTDSGARQRIGDRPEDLFKGV